MKKASIIISIPTPCHESWDAMTPADKGRFCQNCQKTVTDFSNMSDQQIISYLRNREGEVCGRFHAEQLSRELAIPVNKRKNVLAPIAAMVTALTITIPSVQAKSNPEKIQLTPEKADVAPQQRDTLPSIKGIVVDSTSKSALSGVIIILKGQEVYALTDSIGKFELQIPANYKGKQLVLEVHHSEYVSKDFIISGHDVAYIEFPMQIRKGPRPAPFMGAVVRVEAVSLTSKPNFWQRFKYKAGHLFR